MNEEFVYEDTGQEENRLTYTLYENSTYMVISKVAYLIGVPKAIFENEHEPPKIEWYEELERDKNARVTGVSFFPPGPVL